MNGGVTYKDMDVRKQALERAEKAEAEVRRLREVLEKYCNCRHSNVNCFCTQEARATSWERK